MATAEDPADAELRENRFAYLLQPIRDLAANWDIDIAAELEEYLEELEGITFAIEDCGTSLNFAEAALLIQGTTCVYSKKVEYLHNLVFRALETIHSKKQKERNAAGEEDGGRRNARQLGADDLDDAFLALDEVALGQVAGDGDIDLDDSEDEGDGPPELLRPPTTLLALEDAAAGQGEMDAGAYRLTQCAVHESGALLLELRDGEVYDRQLRSRKRGAAGMLALPPPTMGAGVDAAQPGAAAFAGAAAGLGDPAAPPAFDDYDDCDDGGGAWDCGSDGAGDYDEGGAGGGGGIDLDDGIGGLGAPQEEEDGGALETVAGWGATGEDDAAPMMDDGAAAGGVAAQRQRRGAGGDDVVRRGAKAASEPFDPYKPLDPNDKGGMLIKPLQVRKPKRRPMRAAGSDSTVAAPGAAPGQLAHADEFGYLAEALAQARKVLVAAAAKQRRGPARGRAAGAAAAAGLLPRPQGRAVLDWSDVVEAEKEEADALAGGPTDGGDALGGYGDADDWGGDDWGGAGGDSDGEYDVPPAAEGPSALQAALEEAAGEGGKRGAPSWLTGGADAGADAGGDASLLTYEELCRAHIEKLIADAAAQQVQSDLQVRVSTWRHRIDPVLSAEEDRSAFDIHDYGGAILERLDGQEEGNNAAAGDSGEPVPFQRVVACNNRFEVARMFAAMLQLVNNRNVELCKSDAQNPSQPFALQLLSTDRHHETFGEAIEATNTYAGTQAEAGPSQRGEARGTAKGGAKGASRGKAAASKGKGSGGLSDNGSDGGGSDGSGSDEENRGGRRRQAKKGAAAKKPAAKRARKASAKAQAV